MYSLCSNHFLLPSQIRSTWQRSLWENTLPIPSSLYSIYSFTALSLHHTFRQTKGKIQIASSNMAAASDSDFLMSQAVDLVLGCYYKLLLFSFFFFSCIFEQQNLRVLLLHDSIVILEELLCGLHETVCKQFTFHPTVWYQGMTISTSFLI